MNTELRYQVDSQGYIIKLSSHEIKAEKVDTMPTHSIRYANNEWAGFKRHVGMQNPGEIIKYSGFSDTKELKRARNILYLGKSESDSFLKSLLNGHKLEVRLDSGNLCLYVRKVPK